MVRYLLVIFIASLFNCVTGCGFGETRGNKLPRTALLALQGAADCEVLSLHPDPHTEKTDDGFHGWNVLGTTTIKDPGTRERLISDFNAGVVEDSGEGPDCFNPRHGIKVTHDGTTHGFLICFECVQVEWYIDDTKVDVFRITRSPKPTFDQILKAANVPLAENPGGVD